METPQFESSPPDEPTRRPRLGRLLHRIYKEYNEAKEQLSTADLNPHEGRLRRSAAPPEYLPKVPDYPPSDEQSDQ